jgi:biotin transport system substrate-specific component
MMNTVAATHSRLAPLSGFAATVPGRLLIGLAATAVVAAAAHVAIPLPFTPVPLTLQPLAVLGVGLALGPVATGGFLMAYPLVAAMAGGLVRPLAGRMPRFAAAAMACTAAIVALFAAGAGWLMAAGHLSLHQVWLAAVLPFLPGEAVKIVIASGVYSTLSRAKRI